MAITLLHPRKYEFPCPDSAEGDGLVAVGGDLSVDRLLRAYRSGIFPWSDDPITWWSPDPRAIFEVQEYQPPKRVAAKLKRPEYRVTLNRAFGEVVRGCAEPRPGREETWISSQFIQSYTAMHQAGHAHSVEVWQGEKLVGGLYGVSVGGLFAGESMFHRVSDGSKMAFVATMQHLKQRGFVLFDTQVATTTTTQLGAIEVKREEYLRRLEEALRLSVRF